MQSEFCEVVEYLASYFRFRFLIGEQSVFQMGCEICFHTEYCGLGKRTAVIADAFFPALQAKLADAANRLITKQRGLVIRCRVSIVRGFRRKTKR